MSKVAKSTIGLMLATMIAKILGFLRELVLASAYGASAYSDAYLIALNIPTVIFAAIGQAIVTTFIPLCYECSQVSGDESAKKFTNNVLNILSIISIVLSILGFIFTEQVVKLFAMGFKGETLIIAIYFTKILLLGLIFNALSNIMTAILQVENNFVIPGLNTLPYNIIIIISIILSVRYGIFVMIWGTLIGIATTFLFQLPFVIKKGYKYKLYINIKDKYIKEMFVLLLPVFIGVFVNQLNVLIDRSLASTLVEGSISALNYANKLNGFIVSMFIVSIASVIYPKLSQLSSKNNKEEFNQTVVRSINSITLLVVPISVGAIVLAKPIVKILFERNAFDQNATIMTSMALVCYSIGLIGIGLRDILNKVFYSLQDTKTPMINGVFSVILNIVLNFILVKFMGHAGLALATSISANFSIIILFISLNKKIGYFGQKKIIITTIKSIVASIFMGIFTAFSFEILTNVIGIGVINQVITLFISIVIGFIIYLLLIILLKVEEINYILRMINSLIVNIKSRLIIE